MFVCFLLGKKQVCLLFNNIIIIIILILLLKIFYVDVKFTSVRMKTIFVRENIQQ